MDSAEAEKGTRKRTDLRKCFVWRPAGIRRDGSERLAEQDSFVLLRIMAGIKKEIPNILTLCNLLCGCLSILCSIGGGEVSASSASWASIFIFLAAVFDLFDGMVARLLGVAGPLGKELDSLSDVVSFGVAPSFIAYQMIVFQGKMPDWAAVSVLVMALASAYRLGKFNLDEEQKKDFKGMPTPANALFWAALGLHAAKTGFVLNVYFILLLSLLLALLLVSNFKMFAFKGGPWTWRAKGMVYLFLVAAVVLFCVFGWLGIAAAIILYPVFSLLHFAFDKEGGGKAFPS